MKVNQHKKKMVKPLQMELEAVNKSLETIQGSKQKYLDLYETDLIDQEMFKGRIKELNDEMEKLMLRREEIEEVLKGCDSDELHFGYVKEVLTNLEAMIQKMASDEKKIFYRLIIEEIVIKDKKVQEIKLKIDEQVQEDIIKTSLSDKKLDGDIFVHKNTITLAI